MIEAYKRQVRLLLDVLPEIAKEKCLAMHGGTAINLFVRDMPRLSVDIDLTYVEIADRKETLDTINAALARIKERVERLRSSIRIEQKERVCKLQLDENGIIIKIEVNMVGRGLIGEAIKVQLCETAQDEFDTFCVSSIVPMAQLYGGKLCAALDRQHPRDLFDVRILLDNEGFSNEIKRGFMFGLISSNRPIHEMLDPNLLDQRSAFENQFEGMSAIEFSYDDYDATRLQLIQAIKSGLDKDDRTFLLSFNRLEPDWTICDFQKFPSVNWKLQNLERFKQKNPENYWKQLARLETILAA